MTRTGYRHTRLEVDLGALAHNTAALRAQLPASARLLAVVKADAYGLGAVACARTALLNGADFLAVAIPEEGVALREAGITAPILVLGGVTREGARAAGRFGLTQTVFDVETIRHLREAGAAVDVHVKIDSGMGRIGVRSEDELLAVARAALDAPNVRLTGAFTHFAAADAEDFAYTLAQNARFAALAEKLRAIAPGVLLHAANSAALLRAPALCYDMARAGIALYTRPDIPGTPEIGLRETVRWTTRAVYCKEIEAGETVSYGRVFTAGRPTRVLTIPVGYADGYHRAISGRGRALVRGQSAPVIGRVCMDQTMLDVTDIPGAAAGEEVVLLGAQGTERITPREMGAWCGMIDYEVLLSPTARVPRVYA